MVDRQNEKLHKISHKIVVVDQLIKTISIEITIHDQIPEIDIIQIKDRETYLTKETGVIPTIGIEVT